MYVYCKSGLENQNEILPTRPKKFCEEKPLKTEGNWSEYTKSAGLKDLKTV